MAKKSKYEELKDTLGEYVDRKASIIKELEEEQANLNAEFNAIEKALKGNVSTMKPGEYREKKSRLTEITKELDFVNEQLSNVIEAPGATPEEIEAWQSAYAAERENLIQELELKSYSLLKELVKVYEEKATLFEKFRLVQFYFEKAVQMKVDPHGACLPNPIKAIMRLLLIYYNEYDKQYNESQEQTECYDWQDVKEETRALSDIVKKVHCTSVGYVDIPSFQNAYELIKRNDPEAR